LRSKNKKRLINTSLLLKIIIKLDSKKATNFFTKENIKKKIEKVSDLKKTTKPGFFDE